MAGNPSLFPFSFCQVSIVVRVIHLWDQAGVSAILAKYQRKLGHDVKVFKKSGWDPYKILSYYREELYNATKIDYAKKCLTVPKKYDIIHVHDLWQIVPVLRILYPFKIIILHYHGTILRNCPQWKRKLAEACCDSVLVSTKDLLAFGNNFIYVPNPVDTDLFNKKTLQECGCIATRNKKASVIIKGDMTQEAIEQLLYEQNINVQLDAKEWKEQRLPYAYMPKNLLKNEFFIDIFFWKGRLMDAHSSAGLQAMAIGVPTFCSDMKWRNELPEEHKPENVVKQLERIYETECLKHNDTIKKQLVSRIWNK